MIASVPHRIVDRTTLGNRLFVAECWERAGLPATDHVDPETGLLLVHDEQLDIFALSPGHRPHMLYDSLQIGMVERPTPDLALGVLSATPTGFRQ
jgi:hypothetical protein